MSARHLRVPSFAKINLGLEVLGLRQDGYHELRTLFQTIDLKDEIDIRATRGELRVLCDHPDVPDDETNLALRAARELRRRAGVKPGAEIRIRKRIPVGGGLGGGSSNAAAVLLALDRMWNLGLGAPGLLPLARRLGADVPFFLIGGTALGLARGDEVYPLLRQVRADVVLVDPGRLVRTAEVFRRLDARLTPRENSLTIFHFVSSDLGGRAAFRALTNDLEEPALQEAPELRPQVRRIRELLAGQGAALAAMSGSGSSYFGLYQDRKAATRALAALRAAGYKAQRARTLGLDEYQRIWRRSLQGARGETPRGRA